jgi:hypothetical protein
LNRLAPAHQISQRKRVMPAVIELKQCPCPLPLLRFEVSKAAPILRMNRAQLYNRIHDGSLKPQKDGARTYITRAELERYVHVCWGLSIDAQSHLGVATPEAPRVTD